MTAEELRALGYNEQAIKAILEIIAEETR